MKRHEPPDVASILSTLVQYLRGPHHFGMRSGSVMALNTRSRGASKTRVTDISWVPGLITNSVSAMVAAPFPVLLSLIVFHLLLYFFQVLAQPIETLRPDLPVALDPLGHLFEPLRLEPARPPLGLAPLRDQPGALQHLQVLRNAREAQCERFRQLGHRLLTRSEASEDRPAGGVRQSSKSDAQVIGRHFVLSNL